MLRSDNVGVASAEAIPNRESCATDRCVTSGILLKQNPGYRGSRTLPNGVPLPTCNPRRHGAFPPPPAHGSAKACFT
eukprot:2186466-Pyramimonas_sp.AAC.1